MYRNYPTYKRNQAESFGSYANYGTDSRGSFGVIKNFERRKLAEDELKQEMDKNPDKRRPYYSGAEDFDRWQKEFLNYCALRKFRTDEEKLAILPTCLIGGTKSWFEINEDDIGGQVDPLDAALSGLASIFQVTDQRARNQQIFDSIKIMPGEGILEFILAVELLGKKVHCTPEQFKSRVINGLPTHLAQKFQDIMSRDSAKWIKTAKRLDEKGYMAFPLEEPQQDIQISAFSALEEKLTGEFGKLWDALKEIKEEHSTTISAFQSQPLQINETKVEPREDLKPYFLKWYTKSRKPICVKCGKANHFTRHCTEVNLSPEEFRRRLKSGPTEEMVNMNRVIIEENNEIIINSFSQSNPSLIIKVTIGSQEIDALIDSGATRTLIELDSVPVKIREKIIKFNGSGSAVDEHKIDIIGEVELDIKIGKQKWAQTFIVLEKLSNPIILGIDVLKSKGVIIEETYDAIRFKESGEIITHAYRNPEVIVSRTTIIPAGQTVEVVGRIKSMKNIEEIKLRNVIINPRNKKLKSRYNCQTEEVVNEINENNEVKVAVTNIGNEDTKLWQGAILAEVTQLVETQKELNEAIKMILDFQKEKTYKHSFRWKLNPKFFKKIVEEYGQPDIDLFAEKENSQVENFFSEKEDSFVQNWNQFRLPYANPPFHLMNEVVRKIMEEKVERLIIVCPEKENEEWFKTLKEISEEFFIIEKEEEVYFPKETKYKSAVGAPKFRTFVFKINRKFNNQLENLEEIELHKDPQVDKLLKNLLVKYKPLFATNPGTTNKIIHKIILEENTQPIHLRAYRLSEKQKEEVRKLTKEMLEMGVIKESISPWSFPIVLVSKPDGSWRFCVDYRRLNAATIKDRYPMVNISDLLNSIGGNSLFSSMDLASGYWQVKLDPKDTEKTAFSTPDGLYEWIKMPMGLSSAPATFQRLMNGVLAGLQHKILEVYLDDILVYSEEDTQEHLGRLEEVFKKLMEAGLTLKLKKCHFLIKEVKFLGYMVRNGELSVDPSKIEAVRNWKKPTNVKQLQSFIGFATFYHSLIGNFAEIAAPLYKLLQKETNWYWGKAQQKAFTTLKEILTSYPVLQLPDFTQIFIVTTDASNVGVGGVLAQIKEEKELPVAYFSKTLQKYQKNYTTMEKECLGIIESIKYFQKFLVDKPFILKTDHKALEGLRTYKGNNQRILRWVNLLQQFNFEIKWKAGVKIDHADGLSRQYEEDDAPPENVKGLEEKEKEEEFKINNFVIQQNLEGEVLVSNQQEDETLKKLRKKVGKEEKDGSRIYEENEVLKRSWLDKNDRRHEQIILPEKYRKAVLVMFHENMIYGGHLGISKMYKKIRQFYFWPNMKQDIRDWVRSCPQCQIKSKKYQFKNVGLLRPIESRHPYEIVCIDHVGPLVPTEKGEQHILTVVDHFSGHCVLIPCKSVTGQETAELLLNNVFLKHGFPKKLLSDRGPAFVNQTLKELNSVIKTKQILTSPYHPQTDGKTENLNKTVSGALSKYVNSNRNNWSEFLPMVEFAVNTTPFGEIDITPFEVLYGRNPQVPQDLLRREEQELGEEIDLGSYVKMVKQKLKVAYDLVRSSTEVSKNKQQSYVNRFRMPLELNMGDLVLMKVEPNKEDKGPKKFLNKYDGPFEIIEKRSATTYKLKRVGGQELRSIININRLKPFYAHKWRLDQLGYFGLESPEEVDRKEAEEVIKGLLTKKEKIRQEKEESIRKEKEIKRKEKEERIEKRERELKEKQERKTQRIQKQQEKQMEKEIKEQERKEKEELQKKERLEKLRKQKEETIEKARKNSEEAEKERKRIQDLDNASPEELGVGKRSRKTPAKFLD